MSDTDDLLGEDSTVWESDEEDEFFNDLFFSDTSQLRLQRIRQLNNIGRVRSSDLRQYANDLRQSINLRLSELGAPLSDDDYLDDDDDDDDTYDGTSKLIYGESSTEDDEYDGSGGAQTRDKADRQRKCIGGDDTLSMAVDDTCSSSTASDYDTVVLQPDSAGHLTSSNRFVVTKGGVSSGSCLTSISVEPSASPTSTIHNNSSNQMSFSNTQQPEQQQPEQQQPEQQQPEQQQPEQQQPEQQATTQSSSSSSSTSSSSTRTTRSLHRNKSRSKRKHIKPSTSKSPKRNTQVSSTDSTPPSISSATKTILKRPRTNSKPEAIVPLRSTHKLLRAESFSHPSPLARTRSGTSLFVRVGKTAQQHQDQEQQGVVASTSAESEEETCSIMQYDALITAPSALEAVRRVAAIGLKFHSLAGGRVCVLSALDSIEGEEGLYRVRIKWALPLYNMAIRTTDGNDIAWWYVQSRSKLGSGVCCAVQRGSGWYVIVALR
jgi:hypothetical protein